MTKKILFICTGNYYRSRIAEILFNHYISGSNLPVMSTSRGFEAYQGRNPGPISTYALEYLQKARVPVYEPIRFPHQLMETDLNASDIIIALDEEEHKPMMEKYFPTWANEITYWQFGDVHIVSPEEMLPLLQQKVKQLTLEVNMAHKN